MFGVAMKAQLVTAIFIGFLVTLVGTQGIAAKKKKKPEIDESPLSISATISDDDLDKLFARFENEPSIEDVIEKAIQYAQVSPKEVTSWKKRVRNAPYLPVLRTGVDRRWDMGTSSKEQAGQAET